MFMAGMQLREINVWKLVQLKKHTFWSEMSVCNKANLPLQHYFPPQTSWQRVVPCQCGHLWTWVITNNSFKKSFFLHPVSHPKKDDDYRWVAVSPKPLLHSFGVSWDFPLHSFNLIKPSQSYESYQGGKGTNQCQIPIILKGR
jgi:hypothetical protein